MPFVLALNAAAKSDSNEKSSFSVRGVVGNETGTK
jgi:hypothetical protein